MAALGSSARRVGSRASLRLEHRPRRPSPGAVRNIGADVAVGDWVLPSADGEQVDHVFTRRSAFVRRASFDGARAEADTLAANIDAVFITHSVGSPPNERPLERELVLAYDSGADPVVVLTKADLVDDPERSPHPMHWAPRVTALECPSSITSGRRGEGLEELRAFAAGNRTLAFLGIERHRQVDARQRPARLRRAGHHRGPRAATSAVGTRPSPPSCWRCPARGG